MSDLEEIGIARRRRDCAYLNLFDPLRVSYSERLATKHILEPVPGDFLCPSTDFEDDLLASFRGESLTSVKREIHRPTTIETLITSLCTQTERTKWKWKVGEVWCGEGFRSQQHCNESLLLTRYNRWRRLPCTCAVCDGLCGEF